MKRLISFGVISSLLLPLAVLAQESIPATGFVPLDAAALNLFAGMLTLLLVGLGSAYIWSTHIKQLMRRTLHREVREIKRWVKNHLHAGGHPAQVRPHLLRMGYSQQAVQAVVPKLELYQYTYRALKNGHSTHKLWYHLLRFGWAPHQIEEVMQTAMGRLGQSV